MSDLAPLSAASPGTPYVYFILDEGLHFLYIGSTRNIRRRMREHRRSPWASISGRMVAYAYDSLETALSDEAKLISLAKPTFNRQQLGAVQVNRVYDIFTDFFGVAEEFVERDRLRGLLRQAQADSIRAV